MADITIYKPAPVTVVVIDGDPPVDQSAEVAALQAQVAALTTVDTVVDAIKAKTDSLTFTAAGLVDANIQAVNDVAIQGTGAVGTDEWRAV